MNPLLSLAGAACAGAVWGWAAVLLRGPGRKPVWFWPSIILATAALPTGFAELGLFSAQLVGTAVFIGGAGAGGLAHWGWLSAIRTTRE